MINHLTIESIDVICCDKLLYVHWGYYYILFGDWFSVNPLSCVSSKYVPKIATPYITPDVAHVTESEKMSLRYE